MNEAPRFEDLTETTGLPLSPEGAVMMYTRYHVAAAMSRGRRVLELGCGAGQGFGLLLATAAHVVGGDYSGPLLTQARRHYGARVPLVRLSADALPFASASFDLVLLFEASYYVPDMERAFDDIARVLAPGGQVLFVNANPERPDFITSPHSVHYHSADEFRAALAARGFAVETAGAFPEASRDRTAKDRTVAVATSLARRALEALGLVPTTLQGRARLKRLLHRRMPLVPSELPAGFAEVAPRTPLEGGRQPGFKVLYVSGTRPT